MKAAIALVLMLALHASAFITMKNNYFFDDVKQEYFIPRGISYQTYNQPLGQYQSVEQIEYDMRQMYLNHVNSIRIDLSPGAIEGIKQGQYAFHLIDHLLAAAKKYGIRVFAIIGYQYFPYWSPGVPNIGKVGDPGYQTQHPPGPEAGQFITDQTYIFTEAWVAESMSFEHPNAIAYYCQYIQAIASRYKDDDTIAGWILGNEMGYLGLWTYRQLGYDPHSLKALQNWLNTKYEGNIAKLNAVWQTPYSSFSQVYPPNGYTRDSAQWADVTQWREDSLAGMIAKAAVALRQVDKNHMISYSKVGMIFGVIDWQYAGEDPIKIANACKDAGAPLNFWSCNIYGGVYPGSEFHTGNSGYERAITTGLPVLYTELGYTTTDEYVVTPFTQGVMIKAFILEGIFHGALGVHVFDWCDRDNITPREYGFGIVKTDRTPKDSLAFVSEVYAGMAEMDVNLIVNRVKPQYDVGLFWSDATDQMVNTYQLNFSGVWGSLIRLGLRIRIITDKQLRAGDYKNVKLLVLPRNERMFAGDLRFMLDQVIASGVSVYADMDLPGAFDYYAKPQSDFADLLENIFGVQVDEINSYDAPVREYYYEAPVASIQANLATNLPGLPQGTANWFGVIKYNKVKVTSGQTLATFNVQAPKRDDNQYPGVIIKNHGAGKGKALMATFNLGSIDCTYPCFTRTWDQHHVWYSALMSDQFMNIYNELTYTGSTLMQVQHYRTADNRIIIYANNWDYRGPQSVTVRMDALKGLKITDMINHRLVTANSDGTFSIDLPANDATMFIAEQNAPPTVYISHQGTVNDLIVNHYATPVNVTYQTIGEPMRLILELRSNVSAKSHTFVQSTIMGEGSQIINIQVNSSVAQLSSEEDAVDYYFHAYLVNTAGNVVAESKMHVLVSLGVSPAQAVVPQPGYGQTISTVLKYTNRRIERESAFPTVVAIYQSAATSKIDPSHINKVNAVAAALDKLGYVRNINVSDPFFCTVALEGAQYSIVKDLNQIGRNGIGKWFSMVILPGVHVITAEDLANINRFMAETKNGLLIATEGRVGKDSGNEGQMADLFGMTSSPVSNFGSVGATINYNNHPVTRNYTVGASMQVTQGAAWTALTTGTALATTSAGTPLIVSNQKPSYLAQTLVLNYDITNSGDMQSIYQGVSDFGHFRENILKLRWQIECKDKVIAFSEGWIANSAGQMTLTVDVKESCDREYVWRGLTYPWWSQDAYKDSVAEFSSDRSSISYVTFASGASHIFVSLLSIMLVMVLMYLF